LRFTYISGPPHPKARFPSAPFAPFPGVKTEYRRHVLTPTLVRRYMLTNTPGDMGFEQAPFKLTSEFVDVMGGKDSASFAYFRELIVQVRYDRSAVQACIHLQTAGTSMHPFTDSIVYLRTAKRKFNYGVDSEFRRSVVIFFA